MKITGKIAKDGFQAVGTEHYAPGHHKIPRIWIVVADRHVVRVFNKSENHLEEIGELLPAGTVHAESSLQAKSVGALRSISSRIGARRHSPDTDPHAKEFAAFVDDIARFLDKAAQADSFDRVILASSPRMLGDLRKSISQKVQALIVAEVSKDLTKMNQKQLYDEVQKIVWF